MSNENIKSTLEQPSVIIEALHVTEDRENQYAHPLVNFSRIAALWNTKLRPKLRDEMYISPVDITWLMVLMKLARDMHEPIRDNQVDVIGYVDCIDRMDSYLRKLGYVDGIKLFDMLNEEGFNKFCSSLEYINK